MKNKKITPEPGQESVWDYPRPPKLEKFQGQIKIQLKGDVIVNSNDVLRILETSHPPTYYIHRRDFKEGSLVIDSGASFCEFKGQASYYGIQSESHLVAKAAWTYHNPKKDFLLLRDRLAVYAHLMDACWVNGIKVSAQKGTFYGGWITPNIVGPFKGSPGSWGW